MGINYLLYLLLQNIILFTPASMMCPVVDAGPDKVICEPGQSVQLEGSIQGNYDQFYWEPTTGLVPPNSLTPTATVFQTTTYTLVAEAFDPTNLVQNGDFEQGPAGFTTAYNYVADIPGVQNEMVPEGTYSVGPNPNNYHNGFSPCNPQSGGNMMIVNGAGNFQDIWCQTITVEPNTEYELKYWLTSVNPASPAQIQIEMNGQTAGPVFQAGAVCAWLQFTTRWNSGANTSVEMCLANRNTALGGNDFAIDNLCMNKICREEDEVTVEVIDIQAVANGPYTITCDDPVIQLNGSGSTQGPGFFLEWTTLNGNIVSGEKTLFPTINRPGTYILTVYGPGGCEKQVAVEVTGNTEEPLVTAQVRDSVGCGDDSVRFDLLVLPGNNYYEYEWTGPGQFFSVEERPWAYEPGLYTVIVRDIWGCTGVDTIRVHPGGNLPEARPFYEDTLSCAIDSVQLHIDPLDPNENYTWRGPGGYSSTIPEPWVRDTGWYILIAGSDPGCLAIDSVYVTANELAPAPDIQGNDINCMMDTAFLVASWPPSRPARTWNWTTPDGQVIQDSSISAVEAGWYYFNMEFSNGCGRLDSILIEIDTLRPELSLDADTITCQDTKAELRAMRMDTTAKFLWRGPNGFSSSELRDTVGLPGWYYGRVTSSNGCITLDSIEVIRDAEVPSIQLMPDTITCDQDSVLLQWNSPDTSLIFNWTGPGQFNSSEEHPTVYTPGTYYLELSTPNNCVLFDSVTIGENIDLPFISLTTDSIDCKKDSALISFNLPDPGVQYQWTNENGDLIGDEASIVVYSGGDYTLTAIAENGCSKDTTVTVNEDADRPDISLSGDTLDCINTSLWLNAESSTDSLQYSWSGPGIINSERDSALINSGGTYSIEVTATNGCRAQAVINIVQDTIRPNLFTKDDTISCKKTSVTLTGSSTNAISWNWSGPQNFNSTQSAPVISEPGNYNITVTSANGCENTAALQIEADTLKPVIGNVGLDTLTCLITTVNPMVSPGGLDEPVFRWEGPAGFMSASSSPDLTEAGNYRLIVTNDNGCADTVSFELFENIDPPTVDVFGDTLTCSRTQTNLLVVTPNEIRGSTWVGPGGQTKSGASWVTSEPGIYTATITARNGCTASDSYEVVVDTIPPQVSLSGDTLLYCLKTSGELIATSSGNNNYSWFGPGGNPLPNSGDTLTVDREGIYTVEVMDPGNGCTGQASWSVSMAEPPSNIDYEVRPPACGGDLGNLRINGVAGGTGTIRYSLEGNPVQNLNGSSWAPGMYRLRAIDELGCFTEIIIDIPDRVDPVLQLTSTINLLQGSRIRLMPTLNIDTSALAVIRWSPATGLSCSDCFLPWATGQQTIEYTLYVEDTAGCSTQARVLLRIEEPKIFIPNAFTPHNKDGVNDYFIPSLGPDINVKSMAIFDRWGNLLWDRQNIDHTDPMAGWDGTAGQDRMNPGVFVYRIVLVLPGGKEKMLTGDVTLIN